MMEIPPPHIQHLNLAELLAAKPFNKQELLDIDRLSRNLNEDARRMIASYDSTSTHAIVIGKNTSLARNIAAGLVALGAENPAKWKQVSGGQGRVFYEKHTSDCSYPQIYKLEYHEDDASINTRGKMNHEGFSYTNAEEITQLITRTPALAGIILFSPLNIALHNTQSEHVLNLCVYPEVKVCDHLSPTMVAELEYMLALTGHYAADIKAMNCGFPIKTEETYTLPWILDTDFITPIAPNKRQEALFAAELNIARQVFVEYMLEIHGYDSNVTTQNHGTPERSRRRRYSHIFNTSGITLSLIHTALDTSADECSLIDILSHSISDASGTENKKTSDTPTSLAYGLKDRIYAQLAAIPTMHDVEKRAIEMMNLVPQLTHGMAIAPGRKRRKVTLPDQEQFKSLSVLADGRISVPTFDVSLLDISEEEKGVMGILHRIFSGL